MNLIVGATGLLGGNVCELLAAEGHPVKAMVRQASNQATVERLRGLGVEIVYGDLKDRSSLDRACQGVIAIISTASSTLSRQEGDSIETVDRDGQLNLIDAAKAAAVGRFIFVSFADMDTDFPLQTAKRNVEQSLTESGLDYTILRPTFFMEIWLSEALGFDARNAQTQIYGSGHNKISWISYHDVARFALACVNHHEAQNAVIDLGGPEALSPLEVVQIFEEVGGRPFTVEHVSEEQLRAQREAAIDPLQKSFAGLMLSYAQGHVIEMRETLRRFPLRLTSVREYARQARDVTAD